MRHALRQPLWLALTIFLSACAGVPQTPHKPVIRTPVVIVRHATPQPITPPLVNPALTGDIWQQLRSRFVMTDCDADPAVLGWARR